jgi:hypothetical protein
MMGRSRAEEDLAARFGARVEPIERDVPRTKSWTDKQHRKESDKRAQERSKRFGQWHREGAHFEQLRRDNAEQGGLEPDQWQNPWSD